MPAGRAWAPIDTLRLDHAYIVPSRFEPIRDGRIEVVGNGYYGTGGRRLFGFEWADSAWKVRWSLQTDSYQIWPSLTPPNHQMLTWKTTTALDSASHYSSYIVTSDVVGGSTTPLDTITQINASSLVQAAGAWGGRRWIATQDGQSLPQQTFRLYRSDSAHHWTQMRTTDLAAPHGIVMAPLDGSNILVVTSEWNEQLRWGVLRDTVWTTEPEPVAQYGPHGPSMIRQPRGRIRLAWSSYDDFLRTRVFENGAWAEPETIRAALPDTIQHLFYMASLSREEGDRPALAWYGYKTHDDVAWYVWVAFPTDSGFGVGERIPGSWNGHSPTCLVDENEDVWVAWMRDWDGMYWTHSYCTAMPSAPEVSEQEGRPSLRWSLSASAPETWWSVRRSVDGAPPTSVARVRAGVAPTMSWSDSSAPPGAQLRYSIRRECRDVRYRATSAESEWRPRGAAIALALRSENPASSSLRVELSGATAGTLELVLYDLLGRAVLTRRTTASGSGVDLLELPLAGTVRPGLYLLRVGGADGRRSRAAKVVVVR